MARVLVLLAMAFAIVVSPAQAADPATALSNAESTANTAEAEISELKAELGPRQSRYAEISRHTSSAAKAAEDAEKGVMALRSQIMAKAVAAQGKIDAAESEYNSAEERFEDDVVAGIAFFLAALVIALLALTWGWFRASAPVAWLTEQNRPQAIGLTIGLGFVLLIAGGALLGSSGVVAVLGGLIALLGLALPVAFLLARHSAEIQRGKSKPLLQRERMPNWITRSLPVIFGILALIGLGTAVFASDPDAPEITPALRAAGSEDLSPGEQERLERLKAKEEKLVARASRLEEQKNEVFGPLATTRRQLRRAKRQLSSAESDVTFYGNRLAANEEREAREAQREEQLAAEEAEDEAAEECHPSYSGCLDPTASDYDCEGGSGDGPLYTGTVTVTGYDEYGLDDDGDGIGCDP
jgi:hypothetical protein